MKRIIFTFLIFTFTLSTVNAQKGINYSRKYAAGGKMMMCLDSSAKNVYYAMGFLNQPHTAFNFIPQAHKVSIQIYFRKKDNPEHYRYTILKNDKPIVVNKPIDIARLKDADIGEDEILRTTTFGIFPIKDNVITIITYDIRKPQNVYKTIFYGKPIPRAKIIGMSKRFQTDYGVDYSWITNPKETTDLILTEKDDELTIFKDISEIDYLYSISIKEKQTDKTLFASNTWKYGGTISEERMPVPDVNIDKSIFYRSGDYEIVIEPRIKWDNCRDCDLSAKEIEKYITRYTLSITLEEEKYTKKQLFSYTLVAALFLSIIFFVILYINKKRNKKKLMEQEQQKEIAKLQLNSVRSQLNPHFLFNALAGIQNLMNKREIDNANKYLAKFARLTRNVLDNKDLISLSQEKSLLDDYLQMEQLRFGFKYEITYIESLDLTNIEIPSMLLQPFVENAVKHGVSKKASDGKVEISFIKKVNDLVLTVTDNGNGFDTEKKRNGLGLPLSHNRIALLNSVYKENRFILLIESTDGGTKITLTLTDWL